MVLNMNNKESHNVLGLHTTTSENFQVLRFSTKTHKSTIEILPSLGGAINLLQLQKSSSPLHPSSTETLISPLHIADYYSGNPAFKGVLLFPFTNRLNNGKYTYCGKDYQFSINEPSLNNSLHGFLFKTQVSIDAHYPADNETKITLQLSYAGNTSGYPFPMDINVEYRLHDTDGLTVTFNIVNRHHAVAPLAIGWHPYFTLRGNSTDWQIQLPTVKHITVNRRLLPTGHKSHYSHFKALKTLGHYSLDHCFQIDLKDATNKGVSSSYLWSEEHQYGLDIWQATGDRAFNYLQVCTPPARDCIAIEPVSANIDAFNNEEGLTHLEANQVLTQQCGVRLITTKPN